MKFTLKNKEIELTQEEVNEIVKQSQFYGRGGTIVIKKANLEGFLGALGFVLEE